MKLRYGKLWLQYDRLNKSKNWEKMQKTHPQKLAPTLSLKWCPQHQNFSLAKRSELTSLQPTRIRAANAFSARSFPVWPSKRCILQRQFVIWPRVLIIIMTQLSKLWKGRGQSTSLPWNMYKDWEKNHFLFPQSNTSHFSILDKSKLETNKLWLCCDTL